MQFRPNNKDCHIFFLRGGNNVKMHQCDAESYSNQNTQVLLPWTFFSSATGGQKAIRLTAVRSKSFEGEQHRILISAIYIHLL